MKNKLKRLIRVWGLFVRSYVCMLEAKYTSGGNIAKLTRLEKKADLMEMELNELYPVE